MRSLELSYRDATALRREMFLDIACMLQREDQSVWEWTFEGLHGAAGGSAALNLQALAGMSLLDCDARGRLRVIDPFADLARHIVGTPSNEARPVYLLYENGKAVSSSRSKVLP